MQFQKSSFDSAIFDIPFFRLKICSPDLIQEEFNRLNFEKQNLFIDTKIPAQDWANDILLKELGFWKICTQIKLEISLKNRKKKCQLPIIDKLVLDDDILEEHGENFHCDRFSLDPRISKKSKSKLFKQWTKNTLLNPNIKICHQGKNFVSFRLDAKTLTIDLSSVIERGLGIGFQLVENIINYGSSLGLERAHVVTECENYPAYRLYHKCGLRPISFYSCFHYLKRDNSD